MPGRGAESSFLWGSAAHIRGAPGPARHLGGLGDREVAEKSGCGERCLGNRALTNANLVITNPHMAYPPTSSQTPDYPFAHIITQFAGFVIDK